MSQKIKKKEKSADRNVQVLKMEQWSGPLPPPEVLMRFEEVCPGTAKKIVRTFESQAHHRMSLEKKVITSDARNETLGVVFAFLIVSMVLGLAVYAMYLGRDLTALVALLSVLVSLIGIFVYGKRVNKQERLEKEEMVRRRK